LDLKLSENKKALNEEWSKKIDQIKELKDSECKTKLFESKEITLKSMLSETLLKGRVKFGEDRYQMHM
jgi:hypothetical protein